MARRRNQPDDQEMSNRQSPFEDSDFIDDFSDEFSEEDSDMTNEEDSDMDSEGSEDSPGSRGFFSARATRVLIAVVIVLVVVLLALILVRVFLPKKNAVSNSTDTAEQFTPAPTAYEALPVGIPDEQPEYSDLPEETDAPAAVFTPIVFGNNTQPDEAEGMAIRRATV